LDKRIAGYVATPTFTVDLDGPPRGRWKALVEDHREELLEFLTAAAEERKEVFGMFGHAIGKMVGLVGKEWGSWLWPRDLWEEMAGIAEVTAQWDPAYDHAHWVLLNVAYDYYARCTSAVVAGADAAPVHLRAMDWHMDALRDLTVNVIFTRRRREVYRVTTWVGFVGVLTGMRKRAYSVAINYRWTAGGLWRNAATLLLARSWPLSLVIRDVLETAGDYAAAVKRLTTVRLMAPCYIVVCGIRPTEGVVLTRNRLSAEKPRFLAEQPLQPGRRHRPLRWIVQANCDADAAAVNGVSDAVAGGSEVLNADHVPASTTAAAAASPPQGEDVLIQNSQLRVCNIVGRLKALRWVWTRDTSLATSGFAALRAAEVTSVDTIYQTVMRPRTGLYRTAIVYYDVTSTPEGTPDAAA